MAARRSILKLRDVGRQAIGDIDPDSLRPVGNLVLLRVEEEDWSRDSGLIIPENVRTQSCQGTVVAIGPDVPWFDEHDATVGDLVLFAPIQEETFWHDGIEYVLTPYTSVFGKVEHESRRES